MQRDVYLPQVELTMESVLITKWLVGAGDRVAAQQALVEVETQKATTEVPSPAAGYVRKLCVEEGQAVGEKALLCILTDTADEPLNGVIAATASSARNEFQHLSSARQAASNEAQVVKASPAARRIARELNIELAQV